MKRLLALALTLTSCAEAQLSGHAAKSQGEPASADVKPFSGTETPLDSMSDAMSGTSNETADTPRVVSGAFLHCSVVSERSNSLELGCHLLDQNSEKIEAKSIGKSLNYDLSPAQVDGLKFTMKKMEHSERLYDVLYRFKANTLADAHRSADESRLRVTLDEPKSGFSSLYGGTVSSLLLPAMIEKNFSVREFDGNKKIVKDLVSGASFYRNSGADRNWSEALADCEIAVVGKWQAWKLAEQNSLMEAHEHGLRKLLEAANALAMPQQRAWTSSLSTEPAGEAFFYESNIEDAMKAFSTQALDSPLAPALCQH